MADNKKDSKIAGKVALGATVVTLAVGAVATGMALSNKNTRTKLAKEAKKMNKRMQGVRTALEETRDRYQSYQHKIKMPKVGKKSKKGVK